MGNALSLGCGSGGRNLLAVAGNGDTSTVREILANRPDLAAHTYLGNGQNLVHVAAANGDREVLQAVVDVLHSGANAPAPAAGQLGIKEQAISAIASGRHLKEVINARSNSGQTPLMLACQSGHTSCANFLLASGADAFQVDKAQRRSAIHYAAAAGQAGVLKALLDEGQLMHTEDGMQALKNVRVHDMSGQCRYIDSRAENGVTALHLAAVHGEVACVHVLLAAGASMMVRTVDLDMLSTVSIPAGSTPLHLAAQKGQVAIVQAMLQAHADALGNWAREDGRDHGGRRGWEQDGRIDLRSVANSLRQLPYHVAWQRGFREAAQVLNPTIPIDVALENVRELDEGFGSQKLMTLSAYALRKNLLAWLEGHRITLLKAEVDKEHRVLRERVIADHRRKEALKLHSQKSAEASLKALDAQLVSPRDAGHTFALPAAAVGREGAAPAARAAERAGVAPPESSALLPGAADADTALISRPVDAEEVSRRLAEWPVPLVSAFGQGPAADAAPAPSDGSEPSTSQPTVAGTSEPAASRCTVPPQAEQGATRQKSVGSRRSRPRLFPSRPAPPPPQLNKTASQRALALATMPPDSLPTSPPSGRSTATTRRPSRDGSRPDSRRTSRDGEAFGSPSAWLGTPFASPFAQVAPPPADDQNSPGDEPPAVRAQISQHPSGIDLVDPPEMSPRPSTAEVHFQSPSRKSSKTLFSSRSRKGLLRRDSRREPLPPRVDLQRAASIPGFGNLDDDEEDCGICLEVPVNVALNGCNHKLCCECAHKLCQVNKKPPLCPFCRTFIEGFHNVAGSA